MENLNVRFGLRNLLKTLELRTSTTGIPEAALSVAKEPDIRSQLEEFATTLSKAPEVLFQDSSTLVERKASWTALVKKKVVLPRDARSRPGHVLLDYHMPHFWSVKNWKGISVADLARDKTVLYKALWANLRMHSTPYVSELRRSLCMVGGLANVTKYRAPLAKAIVEEFGATSVLDPCIGWGGRMLGALAAGATYTGCEPCLATVGGLQGILKDIEKEGAATILAQPAEEGLLGLSRDYDMILTSPPYFNLEVYDSSSTQSITDHTWDTWVAEWLDPVIRMSLGLLKEGGVSCWSVKNFKTNGVYNLADEVKAAHEREGWELVQTFSMVGSGRPGEGRIKDGVETRGSEEETFCFQKLTTSQP